MMIDMSTQTNGYTIEQYKANLLEYKIGACEYNNGYMLPLSSMMPVKLDGKVGLRAITIVLDFDGSSMNEITTNISNFTAMLHDGVELVLPDGYHYTCVYDDASEPEEKAPWIMQAEYRFYGFRHGSLKTHTLSASGSISVEGNYKAAAIFKLTPATGTTEMTVNGIKVKNISGTVVVDGMNKTVMQNGVNKFADAEMTEFPYLSKGDNSITIAGNGSVEISYYPIYL